MNFTYSTPMAAVAAILALISGAANAGLTVKLPAEEGRAQSARTVVIENRSADPAIKADDAQPAGRSNAADIRSKVRDNRVELNLRAQLTPRIKQDGKMPPLPPAKDYFGDRMAFYDALLLILPEHFRVFADNPEDLRGKSVSFDLKGNWILAFDTVLRHLNMQAHIDWGRNEVTVFAPVPIEDQVAVAQNAAPATTTAEPALGATSGATAAPVAAASAASPTSLQRPDVKSWELSSSRTLRENLRQWTVAEGWTLLWNARVGDRPVDYPVDANHILSGPLTGADSVVGRVIAAYADAEYPLEVEFFRGNRVIEVRLHKRPNTARQQ